MTSMAMTAEERALQALLKVRSDKIVRALDAQAKKKRPKPKPKGPAY